MNEIAPPENGMTGDLYGLQFGASLDDRNLRKIGVCLEPTKNVIIKAHKAKIHLLISHHGITHRKKLYFNEEILDQIKLLSISNVDLFVIHTAWDAAKGGVSESLAKRIGLKIIDNFYFIDKGKRKPIGRIGKPVYESQLLETFLKNIKRNMNLSVVRYFGDLNAIVKKVAVIGGAGLKEDQIRKVLQCGCDTLVSGEFSYPEWLMARKLKLNLIATGHYQSEILGMQNLQKILSLTFPRDEFILFESHSPVSFY